MPISEKNWYILHMEKFVGDATCEWGQKARAFIVEIRDLTGEAFKKALKRWDEIRAEASREIHERYAYNM